MVPTASPAPVTGGDGTGTAPPKYRSWRRESPATGTRSVSHKGLHMRSIALRTKTALAALAGMGVPALALAAALPGTGLHQAVLQGGNHSVQASDDHGPGF